MCDEEYNKTYQQNRMSVQPQTVSHIANPHGHNLVRFVVSFQITWLMQNYETADGKSATLQIPTDRATHRVLRCLSAQVHAVLALPDTLPAEQHRAGECGFFRQADSLGLCRTQDTPPWH